MIHVYVESNSFYKANIWFDLQSKGEDQIERIVILTKYYVELHPHPSLNYCIRAWLWIYCTYFDLNFYRMTVKMFVLYSCSDKSVRSRGKNLWFYDLTRVLEIRNPPGFMVSPVPPITDRRPLQGHPLANTTACSVVTRLTVHVFWYTVQFMML